MKSPEMLAFWLFYDTPHSILERDSNARNFDVTDLVWESIDSYCEWATVRSFWLLYRISLRTDGQKALRAEWLGNVTDDLGVFPTWESAKEGAQNDLDKRQLAAGRVAEWRCFHCDEVFTDEHAARQHFGGDDGATPACQIKGAEGGLIEALRRAEKDCADAWHAIHEETTDAARAYHAQLARHQEQLRAVEQVAYDKGLADGRKYFSVDGVDWTVVPYKPTEAMLRAAMDDLGWWVEPYEAPRESGVPIESDMSAADAAKINAQQMDVVASAFRAMVAAYLVPLAGGTK